MSFLIDKSVYRYNVLGALAMRLFNLYKLGNPNWEVYFLNLNTVILRVVSKYNYYKPNKILVYTQATENLVKTLKLITILLKLSNGTPL